MGANRRLKILSTEGIIEAMRPGRRYQIQNLARAYGIRPASVRIYLSKAVEAGMVDCITTPRGAEYCLVWSDLPDTETVLPPYRNLRLSENLVGYDRSLHKFEALCMVTRK